MVATNLNLTIEQGATFTYQLIWKDEDSNPIDLTGYTAEMQVRQPLDSSTKLLELTTSNGGITLGSTAGTVNLLYEAGSTALLTFDKAVYDLELTSGTEITRLVSGQITNSKEVTR